MSLPPKGAFFNRMSPTDRVAHRAALLAILDMVRVKIDEGHVEDLLFLMLGSDPDKPGDPAYGGSRGVCRTDRIDLLLREFYAWVAHVKEHNPGFDLAELQRLRAVAEAAGGKVGET